MSKGIESWTDADYAQAALDMLPEGVEEIAEFLRVQGVQESKVDTCDVCTTCPIAQWVNKWTDRITYIGYETVSTSGFHLASDTSTIRQRVHQKVGIVTVPLPENTGAPDSGGNCPGLNGGGRG